MTKPMYCPMSFANSSCVWARSCGAGNNEIALEFEPVECTPDCAWALKLAGNSYGCGIAAIAIKGTSNEVTMNARPLKDDVE